MKLDNVTLAALGCILSLCFMGIGYSDLSKLLVLPVPDYILIIYFTLFGAIPWVMIAAYKSANEARKGKA